MGNSYNDRRVAEERARKAAEERRKQEAIEATRQAEIKAKQNDKKYWRELVPKIEKDLKALNKSTKKAESDLLKINKEHDEAKEKWEKQKTSYEENLKLIATNRDDAMKDYNINKGKINDAIAATNVDEGSIPQFLNLINNGLLGGTLSNAVKTVELNAKLQTFGDLIRDNTSTSIPMDMVFKGNLSHFITYLEKEEFVEPKDVLCENEDEFNDIIQVITKGIEAENKEIAANNSNLTAINAKITEENKAIELKVQNKEKEIGTLDAAMDTLRREKANAEEKDAEEKEKDLKIKKKLKTDIENEIKELQSKKKDPEQKRDPIPPLYPSKAKVDEKEEKGDTESNEKDPVALLKEWKLDQYAKVLIDEKGYEDYDDWVDLEKEELEEMGFKQAKAKKFIKKVKALPDDTEFTSATFKREPKAVSNLRDICMKDKASDKDGGWIPKEKQKESVTKRTLNAISPPLSIFFGTMDGAMNDARKYLEFSAQPNAQQMEAIKGAEETAKELKMIKDKEENAEKEKAKAEKEEKEEKKDPDDLSVPLSVPEPEVKDITSELHKLAQQSMAKDPPNLDAKKADTLAVARRDNKAFLNAAVIKLHVVEDMKIQFTEGEFKATKKKGLTLATNVEHCCLQMIESQSTIRASIFIARQLIEFKPMKPGPDAEPLWAAISKGVTNIFNNYIDMAKISATYFSYFVKFKSGFEHYLSAYELEGENVDLDVAMEYIKRDVKQFLEFSVEMQKTVDRLTAEAKNVISDCVNQTAGAEAFNIAQRERDKAEKELLKQQGLLDLARSAETKKLDKALETYTNKLRKQKELEFEIEAAKTKKESLEKYKTKAVSLST